MRHIFTRIPKLLLYLFLGMLLMHGGIGAAQKVPIDFNNYHGFNGTVKYIKAIARAYPDITALTEIGKSTLGRPIYVLIITNKKTGTTIDAHVKLRNMRKEGVKNVKPMQPHQGKPGHWICGSTHGNEYTGTEVCLYTIDKLVTGYDSDAEIKRLVDSKAFYICPIVNPDGVYNSVEKNISQRYNSEKKDNDKDGKVNEDGPDDLNGDGLITSFRYPSKVGRYIIDEEDPRVMIRLQSGEKTTRQRYNVVTEDKDNDGDGRRGEDPEAGIDLNRNFPEGWFKENGMAGGSGDYPTSSPEVHAIAEFFTNHTNILMAQNYHTSGGFTFRPMGTAPHPNMDPKDVAVLDLIMGKKYLEIIGEKVPEAWEKPEQMEKFKAELKKTSKNKYALMRGYELPRGWRVSYSEDRDTRYSYGMATDWMYKQYGIFAITTELWNPRNDLPGFPKIEGENVRAKTERALLKIQEEKYGGKLFVPWKKFKHPELGDGEIGGWIPKYRNNAWPGEALLGVCDKHWRFELFRAGLLPEVVITDARGEVLATTDSVADARVLMKGDQATVKKGKSKGKMKLVEVTATIENKGKLATHLARGSSLAGNRDDVVWLIGARDKITFLQGTPFIKLGTLDGVQKITGYTPARGAAQAAAPSGYMRFRRGPQYYPRQSPSQRMMMFRQMGRADQSKQKGTSRKVKWLVAVADGTPLKIVVSSQKGGTQVKQITIK